MNNHGRLVGFLVLAAALVGASSLLISPVWAANTPEPGTRDKGVLSILPYGPTAAGFPRHAPLAATQRIWPKKAAKAATRPAPKADPALPAALPYQKAPDPSRYPRYLPREDTVEYERHVPDRSGGPSASSLTMAQPPVPHGWGPPPPPPALPFVRTEPPYSDAWNGWPWCSGPVPQPASQNPLEISPAVPGKAPGQALSRGKPSTDAGTRKRTGFHSSATSRVQQGNAGNAKRASRQGESTNSTAYGWDRPTATDSTQMAPIPIGPTIPPAPPVVDSLRSIARQDTPKESSWPEWLRKPYGMVSAWLAKPFQ